VGYLRNVRRSGQFPLAFRCRLPRNLTNSQAPAVPLLLTLTHILPYPIRRSPTAERIEPTFNSFTAHPVLSTLLFLSLALSRLGRGAFALCTTQLAQVRVPSSQRASFASAEITFVSLFGLAHHAATGVWSQPRQFGWVAGASFAAVVLSLGVYWRWMMGVRKWRCGMQ
jgi:Ferroportin1 (FPN1)